MVYFFVDEEEKYKEKQPFSAVNGKVISQSLGKKFFLLTNEKKFETFFFSYIIKIF